MNNRFFILFIIKPEINAKEVKPVIQICEICTKQKPQRATLRIWSIQAEWCSQNGAAANAELIICVDCVAELGIFCQIHQQLHQAFADGTTA